MVPSHLNSVTLQTYIKAIDPIPPFPDHPNFYQLFIWILVMAIASQLGGRDTRFRWIYSLKSLTHSHIIAALELFRSNAGIIPETFYTDFNPKLIKGKMVDWIRQANSKVIAAPSAHQDKNGLVECNWNVAVDMARAFLTNAQMPWNFWFHAMPHATRICNIFPCKADGELTTAFELAYRIKPDY